MMHQREPERPEKPAAMNRYQIVLFDMDGTILDTLQDLSDSVNWALAQCGLPQRSLEENRFLLSKKMV